VQKVKSREFLIKPDGWEIPDFEHFVNRGFSDEDARKRSKFWVDNGFSNEKSEAEGVPIIDALNFFKFHHKDADLVVAHNLDYDAPVLGAEILNAGMKLGMKPKFCTMKATIDFCRLPFPKGGKGFKFPKLEELYKVLFDKEMSGAHQAIADTEACADCYFELLKRGLI
jgi:DNA polymerase III epsilon subunit-like protein